MTKETINWADIESLPFISGPRGKHEIRICCLFCEDEKYHMYVNTRKNVYNCFKCSSAGKIRRTREKSLLNFDWRIKQQEKEQPDVVIKTLPRSRPISRDRSREAWNYLVNRGLEGSEIYQNRLQTGIDREGIYANSIIFPVYNSRGDLKYFVCRRGDDQEPKYVNAPWPKGDTLYRPAKDYFNDEWLAIVEGPFDAIKLARYLPTVALLGKKANYKQINRIISSTYKNLIVALDPDAWEYAVKLKLELICKLDTIEDNRTHVRMLDLETDPGSASEYHIIRALELATGDPNWRRS